MVPAQYVPLMLKLGSKADGMDPDTGDSAKMADEEVKANKSDNKKSLTGLFDNAKEQSVSKYFPGKSKKETSSPLLKVAFIYSMSQGVLRKTAGQVGVMFIGFQDELQKIANVAGLSGIAGTGAPSGSPTPISHVNKELGGFKSLVGHAGAAGAGPGLAKGFGSALSSAGKAVGGALR